MKAQLDVPEVRESRSGVYVNKGRVMQFDFVRNKVFYNL